MRTKQQVRKESNIDSNNYSEDKRKSLASKRMKRKVTARSALLDLMERLCRIKSRFVCEQCGEGFVDVLVKMLIVVVVGAVLLSIMRVALPSLFEDLMLKIRSVFEL